MFLNTYYFRVIPTPYQVSKTCNLKITHFLTTYRSTINTRSLHDNRRSKQKKNFMRFYSMFAFSVHSFLERTISLQRIFIQSPNANRSGRLSRPPIELCKLFIWSTNFCRLSVWSVSYWRRLLILICPWNNREKTINFLPREIWNYLKCLSNNSRSSIAWRNALIIMTFCIKL